MMSATVLAALAVGLTVWSWGDPVTRLRPRSRLAARFTAVPGVGARVALSLVTGASALILTPGLGWWALAAVAVVGGTTFAVSGRLVSAAEARRQASLVAAVPQLCDLLMVGSAAGLPLRGAITIIAEVVDDPLAAVLAGVAGRVELGVDEAAAWTELGEREPALAALARELAHSVESGLALAKTVHTVGLEARRDTLAQREYRARQAGIRSVFPMMLCFLPAFLLLGIVPIIGGVIGRLF